MFLLLYTRTVRFCQLNQIKKKHFNCVCVCVCVCVSGDMPPYCSAHDEWLIMKLCMYVRYHAANNVTNFGGDPVTQLSFKSYNA